MKKTTNHDAKYMLLKRTGMLYKRDVLTRPITMFIISAMATICDGLTVYFTLDPIIKDAWYFTLLLTLTAAAILDIFPAFWEYGFESVKHSQDHFDKVLNKTLLGIAIGSWGLVMIALCVIRYSAADFILESVIENNIDANEYDDAFTPQVTTLLKMGVMTFMNLVNIGTSAAVLLASHISFTPQEEKYKQQAATFNYYVGEARSDLNVELEQLEAIVNDDTTAAYEEQRAANAVSIVEAQAEIHKTEAREELQKALGDSDVSEKLTNLSLNK